MKHFVAASAVFIASLTEPCPILACGFSNDFATAATFRQETAQSKLVVYGTLANPRQGPGDGSTDFLIETVIKPHPILRGKKVLKLSRYVSIKDPKHPPRYLIFCDVFNGQIDPFRGVEVASTVHDYLKGLLALDASDDFMRIRYCFDFLDHADREIAKDALYEFMKTPNRELGLAARKLPASKLRRWLRDPKTDAVRQRLYGFLLGNCGPSDDAILLRSLAIRLGKQKSPPQIDGILAGYALLRPKEGLAHIRELLDDPTRKLMLRYSGLRAARYFHNTRPDVISTKAIVEVLKPAMSQDDFADLVILELRQWRCWDLTPMILPFYGKQRPEKLATKYIRRAILRYALQCPHREAKEFIAGRRKVEAKLIEEVEEELREEAKRR